MTLNLNKKGGRETDSKHVVERISIRELEQLEQIETVDGCSCLTFWFFRGRSCMNKCGRGRLNILWRGQDTRLG